MTMASGNGNLVILGGCNLGLLQQFSSVMLREVASDATAEELAAVLPPAYSGWVLLDLCSANCIADAILRRAHDVSFDEAVAQTVEALAEIAITLSQTVPNLAVWGPIGAFADHNRAYAGNLFERNFALLSFTNMLRAVLARYAIPALSLIEETIAGDGTSFVDYLSVNGGISDNALPQVCRLIREQMGIKLLAPSCGPIEMVERRMTTFDRVEYIFKNDWRWLYIGIPEAARFITCVTMPRPALAKHNIVTIGTTVNDEEYHYVAHTLQSVDNSDKYLSKLPVMTYATSLILSTPIDLVLKEGLGIFAKMLPMKNNEEPSKPRLFAMCSERLLGEVPMFGSQV